MKRHAAGNSSQLILRFADYLTADAQSETLEARHAAEWDGKRRQPSACTAAVPSGGRIAEVSASSLPHHLLHRLNGCQLCNKNRCAD